MVAAVKDPGIRVMLGRNVALVNAGVPQVTEPRVARCGSSNHRFAYSVIGALLA